MDAGPPAKRKRVTKACDSCSKKRKRCDGQQPCSICEASGSAQECRYSKIQKKRGPAAGYNKSAQESLERLRLLSALLGDVMERYPDIAGTLTREMHRLSNTPLAGPSDPRLETFQRSPLQSWLDQRMAEKEATSSVKSPIAGSTSQNNDDELYLNTSDAFTSIPGSSMHIDGEVESIAGTFGTSPWSQSSGPTLISGPPLNPLSVPPGDQTSDVPLHFGPTSNQSQVSLSTVPLYQPSSLSSIMSLSGSSHWPNESIATGLIDSYFQSWHPVMPIIDKQLILTWLMELSTHPSPGHQQQQSPSSGWSQFTPGAQKSTHVPSELICAVFASALPYSSLDSQQQQAHQLSVGSFISQAENFLAASGKIGHPSLHTVQTHVLLSFSCLGLGDYSRASRHFVASLSAALDMGLHQQASSAYAIQDTVVFCRRTWWSVFILDVLMALRFGRATLIQQDLVDNPLPSVTGSEEVELWRPGTDLGHIRDKALRATSSSQNPPQQLAHSATSRVVRSHALSAFNELIKLCGVAALIATRLNRTTQGCPDDTPSMNDILSRLQMWEAALPSQLRPSRSPTEASVLSHEMMLMQKALCLLCLRPSTNDRQLSDTCISAFNNCLEDAESYCRSAAVARSRAGFDYFALAIVTTLTYPLPIHRQRYTKHHWHTCLQVLRQQSVLYPAAQTTLRCLEALPHFKVLTKENTNQQAHVPPAMSVTPKADPLFLHQLPPLPLPSNANAHSWLSLSSDQQWSGNNTGGIGQPNLNAHVLAQDGGLDFFGSGSDDVLSLLGLKGPTRPPSATIGLPSEETQTDRDLLYHFQHQGDVDMSNLSFLL